MTPKETATELVTLFIEYTNLFNPNNPENNGWEKDMDAAKQCALIAVEFARDQFENYCCAEINTNGSPNDHFNAIKQEIEKL